MVIRQRLIFTLWIKTLLAMHGGAVNKKTIAIFFGNPMNAEEGALSKQDLAMNSGVKRARQEDGAQGESETERPIDEGIRNHNRHRENSGDADGPRIESIMPSTQYQTESKNRQQCRQNQVPVRKRTATVIER